MTPDENFDMLLKELSAHLGLSLSRGEDSIIPLEIDGTMALYLQHVPLRESVVMTCELGTVPPDAPASIFRMLLSAQLFDQGTGGGRFALDDANGILVFTFERQLDGMPFTLFKEILQNFIACSEHWRARVEDSLRPSPKTGASNSPGGNLKA